MALVSKKLCSVRLPCVASAVCSVLIAFLTLAKEPEMSTAESRSSISTNVTGITVTTALSLIFLIVIAMLLMVVIRVQRYCNTGLEQVYFKDDAVICFPFYSYLET